VNSGNGSAATGAAAKSAAPLGDRWPEDRLPGRDSPNRAPELFLLGLLDHVSAGPRTHRSEHLFVVVEHVSTSTATSGTAPHSRVAPNPSAQPNRDGGFSEE
jgi:hypothetical protein